MLLMLLAGLSLAADVTDVKASGARPVGNPGEWITPDDYPKAALRAGAEGVTGFRLLIDPAGRPLDCLVIASSGNDGLDAVACALLRERARFTPARDGEGKPMVGLYTSAVRWQIPQGDPLPLQPFSATLGFDVGVAGSASGCRVDGTPPSGFDLEQFCATIVRKARFVPFRAADGTTGAKHVVVKFSVEVSDPAPDRPAADRHRAASRSRGPVQLGAASID